MSESELRERLERFLSKRVGAPLRIVAFERSTEGFSQETFSLDVALDGGETRGYVVKRTPPAGLLEPYDLEPEFRVLHALSGEPLRSPPTPWFEADPAVLERPFYVMEKLPGEVPIPASGEDGTGPFEAGERGGLAVDIAETLAALHAVDWRKHGLDFLGPPEPGRGAAEGELARWEERIERSGFSPEPLLSEALGWLRRNLPSCDEVALVHGDYRMGNFLVERDGTRASLLGVLDWEMVHLGDPLEDLAWCSSELWRGGTPWVGTLVPPEEFAALYAVASGREVDPARMEFYGVLAVVKMIAIMLTGIRAFNEGRTRDLRMAIFDHQLPFLYALLAMRRGWFAGA